MAATKGRFKDFGSTTSIDEYAPLGFALNGEEFVCRPAMSGASLLDFVRRADSEHGGMAAEAIVDFLHNSLDGDDADRFDALVKDPDRIVQVETLGDIAGWLVEQYTARPTKARSRSASGRSNGGRTSTDTSTEEE
jgi:hypothetical protein